MAMKRCPDCGEKYSDSYKYCPFCEEEEILREGKGRGGRRVKGRQFSLLTPVLVVLILLMAGLLIFLLRQDQPKRSQTPVTPPSDVVTPVQPGEDTPSADPGTDNTGTDNPGTDTPDTPAMPDEPDNTTPAPDGSTAAGSEATVVEAPTGVNVRPDPSTSGTPVASLKNGDRVRVVKDAGNGWYEITFSGSGGVETTGYMKGDYLSTAGSTSSSTSSAVPGTPAAAPSGSLLAGSGRVKGADNGVFVRSGPGTGNEALATLSTGDDVQIVESAGDGWYKITFSGSGGKTTTGYMKGDYLTNS